MWKLIKKNKQKTSKKSKKNKKSCVELKISGYNLERTLNFLCAKNVEFYEVEKINPKNARIQIKSKDKKLVKKSLEERKIAVISENYVGLLKVRNFFRLRYGFLIGLFLAVVMIIVLSNFMLNIEVMGTEKLNAKDIVSMLNDNGIYTFKHLNSVSTEQVEKLIIENFDEVSSVSAIKKGCSIIINLKEKVINEEFENLENLSPLLAKQNGIITEIDLIQGTPLVKVGDIVKVGQALIAPYTLDSNGKQIPIVPKANIMADIWLEGCCEHDETVMKTERTGNVVSYRQTTLFGFPLFSNIDKAPFQEYEMEIKESCLTNQILPIKYKEIFYFETKCVIIEKDFESVKEQLILQAKQNALNQITDNNVIKSEDCSYAKNGSKWIITYTITVNKDITK